MTCLSFSPESSSHKPVPVSADPWTLQDFRQILTSLAIVDEGIFGQWKSPYLELHETFDTYCCVVRYMRWMISCEWELTCTEKQQIDCVTPWMTKTHSIDMGHLESFSSVLIINYANKILFWILDAWKFTFKGSSISDVLFILCTYKTWFWEVLWEFSFVHPNM